MIAEKRAVGQKEADDAMSNAELAAASVKAAQAKLAESRAQGEKLAGSTVKLTQKAGVDGRLFGSVTNADIAEELGKTGYKVAKAQIRMPNGPIKTVGDSNVSSPSNSSVSSMV